MKKPLMILMLALVAAVGMSGLASAQLIAFNLTIGNNTSILDPSQNQTQDQAQAQAQTSTNTNTNTLANVNTNTVTNANVFTPSITVNNSNTVGPITVNSANINSQTQAIHRFW